MPCDTRYTQAQREEARKRLEEQLIAGKAKVVVDRVRRTLGIQFVADNDGRIDAQGRASASTTSPAGQDAYQGRTAEAKRWVPSEWSGMGDACALQAIRTRGSFAARMKVEQAVKAAGLTKQEEQEYLHHGHSH